MPILTCYFSADAEAWYVHDRVSSVGYLLPPNLINTNRFSSWDDFKQQSDQMDAKMANASNHAASELADCEVLAHSAWIRSLMGK